MVKLFKYDFLNDSVAKTYDKAKQILGRFYEIGDLEVERYFIACLIGDEHARHYIKSLKLRPLFNLQATSGLVKKFMELQILSDCMFLQLNKEVEKSLSEASPQILGEVLIFTIKKHKDLLSKVEIRNQQLEEMLSSMDAIVERLTT